MSDFTVLVICPRGDRWYFEVIAFAPEPVLSESFATREEAWDRLVAYQTEKLEEMGFPATREQLEMMERMERRCI